jgi:pyruvate/2-oxoglutarate dehydrogenase complex dihydrolipoamide dehydrogenase (E3) component
MAKSVGKIDRSSLCIGDAQMISADKFLIATGSRPREHPFVKADGKRILTSDHISNVNKFLPEIVDIQCDFQLLFLTIYIGIE